MNKQLINKYKLEFDHWLKEGSVLINSDLGWCPIATEFTWSCNISVDALLVINDEYVELRKALAEGKIIQIYDAIYQHEYDPSLDRFGWRDFKSFTASSSFSKTPDLYRIKPDEPKFRVGDFVRVAPKSNRAITNSGTTEFTGIIRFIDKHNLYNIEGIYDTDWFESDDIQPWTPVKGEWCWFYDSEYSKSTALAKFNEMWKNKFRSTTNTPWNFCEPFLNSIPSYLKDK